VPLSGDARRIPAESSRRRGIRPNRHHPALYTREPLPNPWRADKENRMLFLIISEPCPEPPSQVTRQRKQFWDWIAPLQTSGEVRSVHAKVGRGAVVLFDVASNEQLHRRLNEWANFVPARFEIHALIDPTAAKEFLDRTFGPAR
jgi:hypothetical protein